MSATFAPGGVMRRVDWRTNDGAVAVALVAVMALVAAATLYGSAIFFVDAESCASIAAATTDSPAVAASCAPLREARGDSVFLLVVLAGVLLLAAGLTARYRWVRSDDELAASWSAVTWAALPAVWVPCLIGLLGDSGSLVIVGPAALATGVVGAWFGASVLRDLTTRAHLLTASAVVVGLTSAGVATTHALQWPSPSNPFDGQHASLDPGWLTCGVVLIATAVPFAVAVALAKRGRPAPNIWLAGALFGSAVAATLPVFVPDLVPAWRGSYESVPGPAVWLPILLAPTALTLLVWATCAARRPVGARDRVDV